MFIFLPVVTKKLLRKIRYSETSVYTGNKFEKKYSVKVSDEFLRFYFLSVTVVMKQSFSCCMLQHCMILSINSVNIDILKIFEYGI